MRESGWKKKKINKKRKERGCEKERKRKTIIMNPLVELPICTPSQSHPFAQRKKSRTRRERKSECNSQNKKERNKTGWTILSIIRAHIYRQ